ncbi:MULTISPECIES: cytosine deaminase [unclassified Beijerinckia]|uniref:cytosine deaminase n=1 Tax=unclassified Beijerinckia TaxID=2638183 RepID=UPI00089A88D6|nr:MULTISPECIES: cytosine deaminase [unclassified Beijerinckia]MDH7798935.1 cytosine deaminase [Beijerinckia sp. GAS462]SED86543.1 cytosine deaminase [Beijerinckia sp. 28-YEA-48]
MGHPLQHMLQDFMLQDSMLKDLERADGPLRLSNCQVPVGALAATDVRPTRDGLAAVNIDIQGRQIVAIAPAREGSDAPSMGGALVLPVFADLHTHLDKTYIAHRADNRRGTLWGAVEATRGDYVHWTEQDLHDRATFALRCAEAHGTAFMRSHLDSLGPQAERSWRVMDGLRRQWADRIKLQLVAMVPIEFYLQDGAKGLGARVAAAGGLLGGVVRVMGLPPEEEANVQARALDALFALARLYDLDVDLHVDETLDTQANGLEAVAAATLRHDWSGRVTCGHCCSLSIHDDPKREAILALCGQAGVRIVSLPLINTFLQDRGEGRTPRWRGLPPLQEIAACGIDHALASDNCGDPFHPYGDYDLLEVLRETARTAHLPNLAAWSAAVTTQPAAAMGFDSRLRPGGSADLIVFNARSMGEWLRRPQADRIVIRNGRRSTAALPAFSDLDSLTPIGHY